MPPVEDGFAEGAGGAFGDTCEAIVGGAAQEDDAVYLGLVEAGHGNFQGHFPVAAAGRFELGEFAKETRGVGAETGSVRVPEDDSFVGRLRRR